MDNRIFSLQTDPAFRQLSYSDQYEIRRRLVEQDTAEDPDFMALPQTDQVVIRNRLLNQTPAWERDWNPETIQRYTGIVDRVQQGDQTAVQELNRLQLGASAIRGTSVVNGVARLASSLSSTTGYVPPAPPGETALASDDTAFMLSEDFQRYLQWAQATTTRSNAREIMRGQAAAEMIAGGAEFLLLNIGLVGQAGTAIATVAQAASRGTALTRGLFTTVANGLRGVLTRPGGVSSGFTRWALNRFLPEMAENVASGVLSSVQGIVRDTLNETLQNNTTSENLLSIASNFGLGFVMDIVATPVLQFLGATAGTFGRALTRGSGSKPGEFVQDFARRIMTGQGIDATTLNRMGLEGGLEAQDVLAENYRLRQRTQILSQLPAAEGTPRYYQQIAAFTQRMDLEEVDGGRVRLIMDDPAQDYRRVPVGVFENYEQAVTVGLRRTQNFVPSADPRFNVALGRSKSYGEFFDITTPEQQAATRVRISERFNTATSTPLDPNGFIRNFTTLASASPETRSNLTRRFVQSLLIDNDAANVARRIEFQDVANLTPRAIKNANLNTILVPANLGDLRQQELFFDQLVTRFKQNGVGETFLFDGPDLTRHMELINKAKQTPRAWVTNTIRSQGGTLTGNATKGFDLTLRGKMQHFDTFDGVSQAVRGDVADLESVQRYIKTTFDYDIKVGRTDGLIYVTQGGDQIVSGAADVQELLRQHREFTPNTIPASTVPEISFLDNANELVLHGAVTAGTPEQILRMWDNVETSPRQVKEVLSDASGRVYYNTFNRAFEVDIPSMQFKFTVDNAADAKAIIQGGIDDWDFIRDVAYAKGVGVTAEGGRFWFRGPSEVLGSASTLEEARAVLRSLPSPKFVPEISGLPQGVVDETLAGGHHPTSSLKSGEVFSDGLTNVRRQPSSLDKPSTRNSRLLTRVAHQIMPQESMIMDNARAFGQKTEDLMHRAISNTREGVRLSENMKEVLSSEVEKIFTQVPNAQRRLLGNIFAMGYGDDRIPEMIAQLAPNLKPELVNRMIEAAGNWRKFIGAGPAEGLSKVLQVDMHKYLTEYMPRIRKWMADPTNAAVMSALDNPADIMSRALGGSAAARPTINFFGNMLRRSEFMADIYETDIVKITQRYLNSGLRNVYLGSAVRDSQQILKQLDPIAAKDLIPMYHNHILSIGGRLGDSVEYVQRRAVYDMTTRMGEFLNKLPLLKTTEFSTTSLQSLFAKLGAAAFLSFKPFAVLKQIQTGFVSVLPRVGAARFLRALMRTASKEGDEIADILRSRGILRSSVFINNFDDATFGFLEKFNRLGMKAFKSGDDASRITAYLAADECLQETASVLRQTGNVRVFLSESGVEYCDEPVQNMIVNYVRAGRDAEALDVYAKALNDDALGSYLPGSTPLAFRHGLGKLFGQFLSFPIYMIDGTRRAIRNGSWAGKLAFAGRFAAASMAWATAMDAVGIEGSTFYPYQPFMLSGGPYYELFNQTMDLLGGGVQASMSWADLKKNAWTFLVPGSLALRNVGRAIDAFSRGEVYDGFLRFASAPLDRDGILGLGQPYLGEVLPGDDVFQSRPFQQASPSASADPQTPGSFSGSPEASNILYDLLRRYQPLSQAGPAPEVTNASGSGTYPPSPLNSPTAAPASISLPKASIGPGSQATSQK